MNKESKCSFIESIDEKELPPILKVEEKIRETIRELGKNEDLMGDVVSICSHCFINKMMEDNEFKKSKFTITTLNELTDLGFSRKEASQVFKNTQKAFDEIYVGETHHDAFILNCINFHSNL